MLQPWDYISYAFIIQSVHSENRLGGYGAVFEIHHWAFIGERGSEAPPKDNTTMPHITKDIPHFHLFWNLSLVSSLCPPYTLAHCFSLLLSLYGSLKSSLSAWCSVYMEQKKKKNPIIGRKMLSESLTLVTAIILKEGTISVISNAIGWWACVIFQVTYLHNETWKLGG